MNLPQRPFRFSYDVYGNRKPSALPHLNAPQEPWSFEPDLLKATIIQDCLGLVHYFRAKIMREIEDSILRFSEHLIGDRLVKSSIFHTTNLCQAHNFHKQIQTHFTLGNMHNAELDIAQFGLLSGGCGMPNSWELGHRRVFPAYRTKGLFTMMVGGIEQFVGEYARNVGKDQEVFLTVGQPMLAARFYNLGYDPTPGDDVKIVDHRKRFLAMMNGTPPLSLHYIDKVDTQHSDDLLQEIVRQSRPILNTENDPYCFEPVDIAGQSTLSHKNAFRVRMAKTISYDA